jgi:hypothetical protein
MMREGFSRRGEYILLRSLFMGKKLFEGAVVLLGVSLFFAGCEPEAKTDSGGDGPGAAYATTAAELAAAVATGKSPIAVIGPITLDEHVVMTIPSNVKVEVYAPLTLKASATLAVTGELIVHHAAATPGSLVLTAAPTEGAKITGTGKVKAGKTEIVGGTGGWQAVGSSSATNTVTIAATSENKAKITGPDAVVLTVQGVGASIRQLAGLDNDLIIEAKTNINFKTGGSLVLAKEDDTHAHPAKITLEQTTKLMFGAGSETNKVETDKLTAALAAVGVSIATESTLEGYASAAAADAQLTQIKGGTSTNTLSGPETDSEFSGRISSELVVDTSTEPLGENLSNG